MITKLTEKESNTIEEMRKMLAEKFGVSVVDDYVTLRFKNNTISMKIDEIDMGDKLRCFLCDEEFHPNKLYETTIEIKHCASKHKSKIKLCYDCYCPK